MRHLVLAPLLLAACGTDDGNYAWEHNTSGDWVIEFSSPCGAQTLAFRVEPLTREDPFDGGTVYYLRVTFDPDAWDCEVLGDESANLNLAEFRCGPTGTIGNDLEVSLADSGIDTMVTVETWISQTDSTCRVENVTALVVERTR